MDNGQHQHNPRHYSQDPIIDGMTAGVGSASEQSNPLPNNLDQDDFTRRTHDYNLIGNTALTKTAGRETPTTALDQEPGSPKLGQIIDMNPTQVSTEQAMPDGQGIVNIDPTIIEHFADGKIDKDDINYIKAKEDESNPADFVEFVKEARRAILAEERETEWATLYLFLYFLQQ